MYALSLYLGKDIWVNLQRANIRRGPYIRDSKVVFATNLKKTDLITKNKAGKLGSTKLISALRTSEEAGRYN